MASRLAEALMRNYRYVVLSASVGLMLMGSGGLYLLVVALKPIAQDFGWPRTVPSTAYALQFIGAGIGGIVMGHWLDRSGMGKPAMIGAIMIGTGAVLASKLTGPWQLYAIYGVMMGLFGQGTLFSPLMANVIRWFDARRGTAVGIVASGQSLAGVLWPPIFRHFNETVGWRETFLGYGIVALCIMLPLSAIMQKLPPGHRKRADQPASGATAVPRHARPGRGRSSPVMIQATISVAIMCCCIAMAVPVAHIVSHASDIGHSPARGAEMLALAFVTSFLARMFGLGPLADRHGGLVALFVFSAFQLVGVALLVFVDGLAGLYLALAVFGIGYGGVLPCYPIIVREYLPLSRGGALTAAVIFFGGIGMAIGGWLGGWVFDSTGGYEPAFLAGIAFNVANLAIAGAMIYSSRRGLLAPIAE
ncbi:MAG: MFS transporter [Rhodospirillales bacterium]|jgi:MFS family permease|nr:MFS transporter [Rhodospirillales bacterium]